MRDATKRAEGSGVPRRVRATAAGLGLLAVLAPLLLVAAAPILTDDLWFHLGAGRAYASEGPWPAGDPMLHTARPEAPVQHEWLFGVAVHLADRAFGLHGLRAIHLLAVLALLAGVARQLQRVAPSVPWALLATAVYAALSWWRLAQFRPDLFSIGAALAVHALLLAPAGPPSWRRVGSFAALTLVWANVHSLFMVGLALVVAVLLGLVLEEALARAAGADDPDRPRRRARARRLLAALVLGAVAALANPRGVTQHLTFLHSSLETGVWQITDEWTHFHPLSWRAGGYAETPVAWALTNLLALGFLACALVAVLRIARERSIERVREFDAPGFGLGLAAFVAILVSIRFRWLAFLPLAYLLSAGARVPRLRGAAAGWSAAAATAVLAIALPLAGGAARWLGLVPRAPLEYLARSHVATKYHAEGVRFLAEAGIEGRLFNHYWMGGFLGYWLAPRLRTFVDGRAEHYPPDVLSDAQAIAGRLGAQADESSHLDVLDRRRVDVFFGVGTPPMGVGPGVGVYTSDNLAGDPGWVLAFRAVDQALYFRAAGGRENLERAARFYRERGVPFDPALGFEPDRVIREAPDFARRWRLLPRDGEALRRAADEGPPASRAAAAEQLAVAYATGGAWQSAIEAARLALSLEPAARQARRCLVYALLRGGARAEALEEAAALLRLDLGDPRARRIHQIALQAGSGASQETLARLLLRYPLLDQEETLALLARFQSHSLLGARATTELAVWP